MTVLDKESFAKISIEAGKTIADALQKMSKENRSSLLAIREGEIKGIITEREIKSRVLNAERDPEQTYVSDVMFDLGGTYIVMTRMPVGDIASAPIIMDVEDMVTDAVPMMRQKDRSITIYSL